MSNKVSLNRRSVSWAIKALVLLALFGAAVYWVKFSPVAVQRHEVVRGELRAEVLGTGTLEARVHASVSPKIAGRIRRIAVDQGDQVSEGSVLVTLDDDELQHQVEIAQANLEAAQAAIDRLKSDEVRASAILTQATSEHRRNEKLAAENAVPRSAVDKSLESLAIAEAGVARAVSAVTEGRKHLVTAEKTLKLHQVQLADTRITAPFDGLIVKRQRDSGDIAVPGSPILTLISTDELWISAWVDETEMSRLRVDQPARVVFRSEPGREFTGKVSRMGREADRETREFVVDVRVLELPANWAVGQRADVYIETDRKSAATLLPPPYLVWKDDEPGVFIDAHGTSEWRPLVLGLRRHDLVEVVKGIEPGEKAIMPVTAGAGLQAGRRIHTP